jgi:hypothetical protein
MEVAEMVVWRWTVNAGLRYDVEHLGIDALKVVCKAAAMNHEGVWDLRYEDMCM